MVLPPGLLVGGVSNAGDCERHRLPSASLTVASEGIRRATSTLRSPLGAMAPASGVALSTAHLDAVVGGTSNVAPCQTTDGAADDGAEGEEPTSPAMSRQAKSQPAPR